MRVEEQITQWQQDVGLEPVDGHRGRTLEHLQVLAFDLIKHCELERAGIRDGDGEWHGLNPLAATVAEIVAELGAYYGRRRK
jgi:hypothetical protein